MTVRPTSRFENWEASVARQGKALASLIGEHWGACARTVLDAAVGIGTQSLGLQPAHRRTLEQTCDSLRFNAGAQQPGASSASPGLLRVTGSDLSPAAVNRARREAAARHLPLTCLVADFRALPVRTASVGVVIVCDNALPHLESPGEIETALGECFRCARPGGGCLVSMRDYGPLPPAGTVEVRPYGERAWAGRRYHLRQVWSWRGPRYDYSFEITPVDGVDDYATILKSSYFAIPVAQVAELMCAVGFQDVRRVDDRFFQPVLVGTRPVV